MISACLSRMNWHGAGVRRPFSPRWGPSAGVGVARSAATRAGFGAGGVRKMHNRRLQVPTSRRPHHRLVKESSKSPATRCEVTCRRRRGAVAHRSLGSFTPLECIFWTRITEGFPVSTVVPGKRSPPGDLGSVDTDGVACGVIWVSRTGSCEASFGRPSTTRGSRTAAAVRKV